MVPFGKFPEFPCVAGWGQRETAMPELYGQPYKWELRNRISELRQENWNFLKENRELSRSLRYSRARADALEAKLTRIKESLGSVISDIDGDLTDAVVEHYTKRIQTG
jgi:hypothetical protein